MKTFQSMICNYLILMDPFHLEISQHVHRKENVWPSIHQIHQGSNQLLV
jgi:hypothetical protein